MRVSNDSPRTAVSAGSVSTQYGGLSRRERQCQLVGESFPLSLNDAAVFLDLFRAIDNLDRLPRRDMQVLGAVEQ